MRDTARADQHAREEKAQELKTIAAMVFSSRTQSQPNESISIGKTKMKKIGGGEVEVDFNTMNFKTQYFDEYTGEPLPNDLVRAAMIEEMSYFSEKSVWTAADWADMKSSKDATFVRMRWVLCNKGDLKEPDVRAPFKVLLACMHVCVCVCVCAVLVRILVVCCVVTVRSGHRR